MLFCGAGCWAVVAMSTCIDSGKPCPYATEVALLKECCMQCREQNRLVLARIDEQIKSTFQRDISFAAGLIAVLCSAVGALILLILQR
jgi:hypothetical protein